MLTGKKLGAAIERARILKGVKKADLAREFGVQPPSVTGWVKTGAIAKDTLMDLIRYFDDVVGPEHWGEPPSAVRLPASIYRTDQTIVEVPRFDVAASMGTGRPAPEGYVDVVESIAVSRDYLSRAVAFSSLQNLAVITGFGDSMLGTFSDGDLLLVDRGVTSIKLDAVYVILYKGELFIKRIQRRPGAAMLMISDNQAYPPIEIKHSTANGLAVLGRVLMAWNARKL